MGTSAYDVVVRPSRIDVALGVLAVAYAVFALVRAPAWTVDDALIVVRYADNAVTHGRLAFNADGERVEGFTSVAAMAIAVAARAIHVDPLVVLDAVGALSYLALAPLLVLVARALRAPAGAGGSIALVGATMGEHATHATSGLETELFVAVTLATVLAFVRALRRPRSSLVPLAAACTVAALVRPEGLVSGLFVVLVLARRRFDRRALGGVARALVAPLALVLALRLAYFGDVLPNTFYAKSGTWNAEHLRSLGALVLSAFGAPLGVAAIVAVLAALSGRRVRLPGPTSRIVVLACLGALALEALGYARSLPVMDYGRRFAFHGLAYVLVPAVALLGCSLRAARGLAAGPALLALGLAAGASQGIDRARIENDRSREYERTLRTVYVPAAEWIRAHTKEDATVAVYPDAGVVPLVSERRAIDFGRLNDRFLARARSDAEVVRYFFDRAPDVLVVSEPQPGTLYDSGADAIVAAPAFAERYVLAGRFASSWRSAVRVYTRVR